MTAEAKLDGKFLLSCTDDNVPAADRPPVGVSFQSYHLMIALGTFFVVLTLAAISRWK